MTTDGSVPFKAEKGRTLSLPHFASASPSHQPCFLCQTRSEDCLLVIQLRQETWQLYSLPEVGAPARLSPIKEPDRQKQGTRVSEKLHPAHPLSLSVESGGRAHTGRSFWGFFLRSKGKMCKERKVFVFSRSISFQVWNKELSPGAVAVILHQRRQRTQAVEKQRECLGLRVTLLSHTPDVRGTSVSTSQTSPAYASETRKPSVS